MTTAMAPERRAAPTAHAAQADANGPCAGLSDEQISRIRRELGREGDELELPTAIERQCHNLRQPPWGFSQKQIAEIMRCSRETVCRALRRFEQKRSLLIQWAANRRLGPEVVESLMAGRVID